MLEELNVANYALIDRLHIDFLDGLTVLSGETGTGKSILAGALGLILGVKAETDSIRTGAEEAVVSGIFKVEANEEARNWLKEQDIAPEDGRVVIRRTVKKSGRGSIYIQSVPINRSLLRDFTALIVDMHGQHEHQSLLDENNHRSLLDQFGKHEDLVKKLSVDFNKLSNLKKRYNSMLQKEQERLREMDLLQFAVKEIEEADLSPGEEEDLKEERNILSQHEKLFGLMEEAYNSLSENRNGALSLLRETRQAMDGVAAIDSSVSPLAKRVEDSFFELEDVAESIHEHRSGIQFSHEKLEMCEDRLALIHRLEKKYGTTVEDVLAYLEEAREELSSLENWETDKERLQSEIKDLEKKVYAEAQELSAKRKETAKDLQARISENLESLGMAKSKFEIRIRKRESEKGSPVCGPNGFDNVAFMISPNPGEPLKSLKTTASGGEISRVMLAIKTVLAESDFIGTLVFDEIDVGIGGEVAVSVGHYLQRLSEYKQILCITHLASIAVRADNHIKVEKRESNGRTVTNVMMIQGDERVEEIARMLAGDRKASTSLSHANELLSKYARSKEK